MVGALVDLAVCPPLVFAHHGHCVRGPCHPLLEQPRQRHLRVGLRDTGVRARYQPLPFVIREHVDPIDVPARIVGDGLQDADQPLCHRPYGRGLEYIRPVAEAQPQTFARDHDHCQRVVRGVLTIGGRQPQPGAGRLRMGPGAHGVVLEDHYRVEELPRPGGGPQLRQSQMVVCGKLAVLALYGRQQLLHRLTHRHPDTYRHRVDAQPDQ
ncbi:predicted protein [Streptomyces iranensis]|uniref:Uncharacterized protein n=1 Tax=Streptomyces iranensis TaxID=576784 RepID=A0A060ZG98_9ACTN|nr:predicted protein [Streptomyces iranensis]